MFPLLKKIPSLYVSGGGRLSGKAYLYYSSQRLKNKGITCFKEKVQLKKKKWVLVDSKRI